MIEMLIVAGLSIAYFSKSLIVSLVFLLSLTLLTVLLLEDKVFMIWGGVMFLIVFLTGLFVIFSYITSTSPKDIDLKNKLNIFKSLLFFTSFFFFMDFFKKKGVHSTKFFSFSFDWSMGGFIIMFFLLVVIIFLIRSTYGKGGPFRKKF